MAVYKNKSMVSPYALPEFMSRIGNTVSSQLIEQAMALGIPMSAFTGETTGETTGGTGMANTGYNEGSSGGGAGGGFGAPSGYGGQSFVDDFIRQLPQNFWGDYFDQSGLAAYEKRGGLGAIMEGLMGNMANRDDLFQSTRPEYTQFMETSRGRADKLGGILDELRANRTETPDAVWSYGGSSVSVPQGLGTKRAEMAQELAYQQELRALDQAGLGALGGRAAYEGDYLDKGTAEWSNLAPILMAYSEAAKDPYRDLQGAYGQMMGAGIQGQESALNRAAQMEMSRMANETQRMGQGVQERLGNRDTSPGTSAADIASLLGLVGTGTGGAIDILKNSPGILKALGGLFGGGTDPLNLPAGEDWWGSDIGYSPEMPYDFWGDDVFGEYTDF